MRVKCVRIINRITGREESHSDALTVGSEYVVLSVEASAGQSVELRIMDDEGVNPTLFTSDQFVTTSPDVPSNWRVRVRAGGTLDIAPLSWLRAGFWEDFFNGHQDAQQEFDKEKSVIMGMSG